MLDGYLGEILKNVAYLYTIYISVMPEVKKDCIQLCYLKKIVPKNILDLIFFPSNVSEIIFFVPLILEMFDWMNFEK